QEIRLDHTRQKASMRAMAGDPRQRLKSGKVRVDLEFLAKALGQRLLDCGCGGEVGHGAGHGIGHGIGYGLGHGIGHGRSTLVGVGAALPGDDGGGNSGHTYILQLEPGGFPTPCWHKGESAAWSTWPTSISPSSAAVSTERGSRGMPLAAGCASSWSSR